MPRAFVAYELGYYHLHQRCLPKWFKNMIPDLYSKPTFSVEDFSAVERRFISYFNHLTQTSKFFRTVGVDGTNGKWLAAEWDGTHANCKTFDHISELCSAYIESDVILIDIPIGLPENASEAAQCPDQALRNFLKDKNRKSSVFNTPFPLWFMLTRKKSHGS